ncbi:putative serine threonine protein phosphatase [Rosellinia necatrix]|uniref:Putative serine threonine protein phosphatase n=1 Tax=Rosellinia necatrix TaxID=77044 RepID=A0A1S7UHJ8_ROSNE|nr:putative serine threonine protein phosphatase [Rosellinia necatrix]
MDPDCAICHAPATHGCDCEAKGLEHAVQQAEHRMMQSVYTEIRSWVRAHAQDYILEYFRLLTERRKAAHTTHMEQLNATAYHYYHAPPHPSEVQAAQATLKRGIDEDWQSSVQRYPEVLEYFFTLVELNLPAEDDPAVKDPPLSALNGAARKGHRRSSTIAAESAHERARHRRTPPPQQPPPALERRTPGPPLHITGGNPMAPVQRTGRRQAFRPPTAPPQSYYGGGGF